MSAITAEELAVVRRFLDRRGTLEAAPRETLARRLADRLRRGSRAPGPTSRPSASWRPS